MKHLICILCLTCLLAACQWEGFKETTRRRGGSTTEQPATTEQATAPAPKETPRTAPADHKQGEQEATEQVPGTPVEPSVDATQGPEHTIPQDSQSQPPADHTAPAPQPQDTPPQPVPPPAAPEPVLTGTIWAPGVTQAGGYFDVNKKSLYWSDRTNGETNTCWQATSANLIAWWQQRRGVAGGLDAEQLYQKFRAACGNVVGTYQNGLGWYIAGTNAMGKDPGGYLSGYTRFGEWRLYPVGSATGFKTLDNFTEFSIFSQFLVENMGSGAMGMKLVKHRSSDGSGHAVTLWGVHLTDGAVDKVYITDSDDQASGLQEYAVRDAGSHVQIQGYDGGYYDKIYGLMALFQ